MSVELIQEFFRNYFGQFAQSALFQNTGLLFTFLYAMSPSFIPIPTEIFMSVLILAKPISERFGFAMFVILITTIASIITDILFVYLGRHLHHITKSRKKSNMSASHSFHKYGLPFFLLTPSMSIVLWGANEALLVYSGHYRANIFKVIAFVVLGELIRGFIVGYMILHGLGVI